MSNVLPQVSRRKRLPEAAEKTGNMDEKEFREKVIPLQHAMYSLALRAGLPLSDSADVVQETQLKLWRGRKNLPSEDTRLRSYCMKALRNECISAIRQRRETHPVQAVEIERPGETRDHTETQDTRSYIIKLISTLPERQRTVITMYSLGEFDNDEICEATGLSRENVRQLLSRARKRLRKLFEDPGGLNAGPGMQKGERMTKTNTE